MIKFIFDEVEMQKEKKKLLVTLIFPTYMYYVFKSGPFQACYKWGMCGKELIILFFKFTGKYFTIPSIIKG